MEPFFPVFVRNIGAKKLYRFNDIDEMQRQVEFQDVEGNEYEGWDGQGRKLAIVPGMERDPIWVKLAINNSTPEIEQVKQAMQDYASTVGLELSITTMGSDLPSCYDATRARIKEHWKSKPFWERLLARF